MGYTLCQPKREVDMIKTLTKHGNSYAMVIEKPILELLHTTPDTPFEIISDGRSLVLTPVRSSEDSKKFDEAVAMVHKRFGKAMKRLAE
jgi:antitoxin component of MazEF toxin-antitoxin module